MSIRPLRRRITLILCLLVCCGIITPLASAAKPGGGGGGGNVPSGVIYFHNGGGSGLYWSMKADGSNKLPSIAGEPSRRLHGNSRWFLQSQYSAERDADQWLAVNENGITVALTDDPDIRRNGFPPVWAQDDSFFSYCGVYETETEWIGRLFVIDIDWSSGVPLASVPVVVFEMRRPVFDEFGNYSFEGYDEVNLERHDWAPWGNEVALTRWVWGTGYVLDILTFTDTAVESRPLATRAGNPQWSPDGSRIAFNRIQRSGKQDIIDVWSIHPDGTNSVQLTKYVSGREYNGTSQHVPTWSPDGAYLAYAERVISSSKTTWNICRIPAAGGTKINLTSDGKSSYPRWRP